MQHTQRLLEQSTQVPVVVRARRTPQCPPLRYTSAAISPSWALLRRL